MDIHEETRHLDDLLRSIHRSFIRYVKGKLQGSGPTFPQFQILWVLSQHPQTSMSFLHEKIPSAKSTLTATVDNLVRDRLVERRRNTDDRRVVLLDLTDEGRGCLEDLERHWLSRLQSALSSMSGEDRADLILLVERLFDGMDLGDRDRDECGRSKGSKILKRK